MIGNSVVAKSALQAKRGTKQTCKNEACASRYYDLSRAPSTCPYCGASCDNPVVVRVDFETLGKQLPRKFGRWVEPSKTPAKVAKIVSDEAEVADEQAEKETDIPSTAEDLLIDVEDEDEREAPVENESET